VSGRGHSICRWLNTKPTCLLVNPIAARSVHQLFENFLEYRGFLCTNRRQRFGSRLLRLRFRRLKHAPPVGGEFGDAQALVVGIRSRRHQAFGSQAFDHTLDGR